MASITNGKQLMTRLRGEGWAEVRSNGSHRVMKHPDRKDLIVVPHRTLNPKLVKWLLALSRNGERRIG